MKSTPALWFSRSALSPPWVLMVPSPATSRSSSHASEPTEVKVPATKHPK